MLPQFCDFIVLDLSTAHPNLFSPEWGAGFTKPVDGGHSFNARAAMLSSFLVLVVRTAKVNDLLHTFCCSCSQVLRTQAQRAEERTLSQSFVRFEASFLKKRCFAQQGLIWLPGLAMQEPDEVIRGSYSRFRFGSDYIAVLQTRGSELRLAQRVPEFLKCAACFARRLSQYLETFPAARIPKPQKPNTPK